MFAELGRLSGALSDYIEATYHISDPALVASRRFVLSQAGNISQDAFLESTPIYRGRRRFAELNIPAAAKELLSAIASKRLLFDPPYPHQAKSLEVILGAEARCVLATTGTGSGKTETFLLPILGKLATEAAERPEQFSRRAVRSIILYPMNALVNDQLGRLRLLFGADPVRHWFTERAGRPLKFARYTGRTLYPGLRSQERNQRRLKSLNFYRDLETRAQTEEDADALIKELRKRGRWPAKPPADGENGMTAWLGSNRRWLDADGRFQRAIERPEDSELLLRHEVQDACPDLLITNYSMLEYMLLRPIERPIFEQTRQYLEDNPNEHLLFVLDEAHLYRGAGGTEVALLIRRLRNRLGLCPDRLQVIATSVSFSDGEAARHFIGGLVGRDAADIEVLTGDKHARLPSGEGNAALAAALGACRPEMLRETDLEARFEALRPILAHRREVLPKGRLSVVVETPGVESINLVAVLPNLEIVRLELSVATGVQTETEDEYLLALDLCGAQQARVGRSNFSPDLILDAGKLDVAADGLQRLVHAALEALPVVGRLVNLTSGAEAASDPATSPPRAPLPITGLPNELFADTIAADDAKFATDAVIELASYAKADAEGAPILAARVHTLFRGLPGLWACADETCEFVPAEAEGGPTGALYAQADRTCSCNARVFQLHTCRDCGVAYFEAFALNPRDPDYLWAEDVGDLEDVEGIVLFAGWWREAQGVRWKQGGWPDAFFWLEQTRRSGSRRP